LATLATGPTCFAAAAGEIRQRDKVARYANRRYAGPGGIIVRIFDGIAEVTRNGDWLENVPSRYMDHVYRDIERGKLVEMRA
jgi:hypothetical protein